MVCDDEAGCANSNMDVSPQNERMLDVSDIVAILSSLYETISVKLWKMKK